AFLKEGAVEPSALFELQHRMLSLQERVVEPHTYQSVWYEWVLNLRAIWYLYEPIDGAHRGVMLIGNPLTVLLGLPAMMWCAWAAGGAPPRVGGVVGGGGDPPPQRGGGGGAGVAPAGLWHPYRPVRGPPRGCSRAGPPRGGAVALPGMEGRPRAGLPHGARGP